MTSLLRNERCGILFWNKKKAPELSAPSGIGAADFAGAGTPLKFNSVDFRDGQQSLFATRLTTADMIPLLEQMDATRVTPEEFSPLDGFIFDASSLSSETAALESVKAQYMTPLLCGVTQDRNGDYENVLAQLDKAGIQKYIEEMQRQLTAFKEKKS